MGVHECSTVLSQLVYRLIIRDICGGALILENDGTHQSGYTC